MANDLHYVVIKLFTKDTWAVEDEQENATSQLTNRRICFSPSTLVDGEEHPVGGSVCRSWCGVAVRAISYWNPETSCRLSGERQQLRTDAGDGDQ